MRKALNNAAGKDAIVLVHGFNHDARCWNLVVKELRAMAPEVEVLSVDLPGRGSKKREFFVRSAEAAAKSVIRDIDRQNIHRAFLVGHSLAGHTLPHAATLLGEERLLGQMYIAASIPPDGKSFFTTLFPWRVISLPIELFCKTNIPMKVPKPLREYLWCCKTTPKEVRDLVHSGAVWEGMSLFGAPVHWPKGIVRKNSFWVRTLQDRGATQRLQSQYRDELGYDEEIFIDAPHDCMLSHPRETAEIILAKYRQCRGD
ncbi:MAG: alpha/beta hydrolase [Clostridia bacterium]|nr:alpha/beta hydrolase [Clostridia bacterium]